MTTPAAQPFASAFISPERVWPDLEARIALAHQQFGVDLVEVGHVPSLESRIAEAVDAARADGESTMSRLPSLADRSAREAFDDAFTIADQLFGDGGLGVPDVEDFRAAGVDFEGLGKLISASLASDAEYPLTPVLAPHGLGPKWWLTCFASLRANASIAGNPLRKSSDGDGLSLASDVYSEFRIFDAAPEATRDGQVPEVRAARASNATPPGEIVWTLRLIPAGPLPVHMNLNYRAGGALHPTLPEMLALQAGRILSGRNPIDRGVFTWLAGTIGEGKLAARHVCDEAQGLLRISSREIGNQGSYLGVRPPIAAP